jgi:hypothetical protein
MRYPEHNHVQRPEWQSRETAPEKPDEIIVGLMDTGALHILTRAPDHGWVDLNDGTEIHHEHVVGWSPIPLVPIELFT